MKRLNVYDSVNRNRLLGTHPRWSGVGEHFRLMGYERASAGVASWDMVPGVICNVTTSAVTLTRVMIASADGWEAEVALVTTATLGELMRLRDFRLPGEHGHAAEHRRYCY